MKNNKGISLVEIIIALGIIGGLLYGVMNFMDTSSKNVAVIEEQSRLPHLLNAITDNIISENMIYPGIILTLAQKKLTPDQLFEPKTKIAEYICFDLDGTQLPENTPINNCPYQIYFFQEMLLDGRFREGGLHADDSLASIPMVQFNFKLIYTDKMSGQERVMFFSKIKQKGLSR